MTRDEFRAEPVIGRHVSARIQPKSEFSQMIDREATRLGIERRFGGPHVRIEVGDVDWDETRGVTLRLETLCEIADYFYQE